MRVFPAAALTSVAILTAFPTAAAATPAPGSCDSGEFCVWTQAGFTGERHTWDLSTAGVEQCVALPDAVQARSFANRVGRPVTTYQSRECGTEGEFDTYPGDGTWVPQPSYTVRAFTIWEH